MTCKDCGSIKRKLSPPGPRCATCHRARKAAASKRAHEKRVTETYGLRPGEYDRLLAAQDGRCAICLKELPYRPHVDHDHATGWVRGLLCKADNSHVLRYAQDDPDRLRRAADYLENPPAIRIIGYRSAQNRLDDNE